jgi:hypothetical protein
MKKIILSLGLLASMVFMGQAVLAQQREINKVPHGINPNSKSPNFGGFQAPTGNTRKATALVYHGGPLITGTVNVYLIWYGTWTNSSGSDTPAGQQIVRDWAAGIGGTPYFNLNQSLSVSGSTITGQVFYAGETTDTGTSTALSDSDILAIVSRNVGSGKNLQYDPNGVYFVITSSNVNETSGFCTQYCGWHTAGNTTSGDHVRYSFIGNAARCITSCAIQSTSPNGNAGVDGAVSVLSHELEEATTDPDLNAWYARTGYENADECAWTFGHFQYQTGNGSWANMNFNGRDWMIQRNLLKTGSSFYCMVDSTHN